jgi:hypothetical protein
MVFPFEKTPKGKSHKLGDYLDIPGDLSAFLAILQVVVEAKLLRKLVLWLLLHTRAWLRFISSTEELCVLSSSFYSCETAARDAFGSLRSTASETLTYLFCIR